MNAGGPRHLTNSGSPSETKLGLLRKIFDSLMAYDNEMPRLLGFLVRLPAPVGTAPFIVDVGCGRGRILRELTQRGYDAVGIEVNPALVAENRAAGLRCLTPDEWERDGRQCDVIIMAHIIEHFAPADLLAFMDNYLARLKLGGHLVVATPLMSPNFYDDFDHVKPYQPAGLMMVFGGGRAQVQYYARTQLKLRDLWFRRSPLRPAFRSGLYLRTPARFFWMAVAVLGMLVFRLTFGVVGRRDGWVGVFRKII